MKIPNSFMLAGIKWTVDVVPEGSEGGGGIVYSVTMFTNSPGV